MSRGYFLFSAKRHEVETRIIDGPGLIFRRANYLVGLMAELESAVRSVQQHAAIRVDTLDVIDVGKVVRDLVWTQCQAGDSNSPVSQVKSSIATDLVNDSHVELGHHRQIVLRRRERVSRACVRSGINPSAGSATVSHPLIVANVIVEQSSL